MFITIYCSLIVWSAVEGASLGPWSYYGWGGEKPPHIWGDAASTCTGKQQSPIDIVAQDAVFDPLLTEVPLNLESYSKTPKQTEFKIQNNGKTVVVTVGGAEVNLNGGGLDGEYSLAQFHLHWGDDDRHGSEHALNGEIYPIELHFVHTSKTKAITAKDFYAVLGVFIKIGDQPNEEFDDIASLFDKISFPSDPVTLHSEKEPHLDTLLPENKGEFYRYFGSLTTPPCTENVIWTVFKNPIYVSKSQFDSLHTKLHHGDHDADGIMDDEEQMENNYRPLQPLHNRKVLGSTKEIVGSAKLIRDWGYDKWLVGKGAEAWPTEYGKCAGVNQSPVNLETPSARFEKRLEIQPLDVSAYDNVPSHTRFTVTNNAHTVQISVSDVDISVTSGGLPGNYRLVQFHLHWGDEDSPGSEHTINGNRYPAELHLVHVNEQRQASDRDYIAVLGVMITIGDTDNAAFTSILNEIKNVQLPGAPIAMNHSNEPHLEALLPNNRNKFYRYHGSLTTPPCSEVVIWTVFEDPIEISKKQMGDILTLHYGDHDEDGFQDDEERMTNNFRPVMPLNGRHVLKSWSAIGGRTEL